MHKQLQIYKLKTMLKVKLCVFALCVCFTQADSNSKLDGISSNDLASVITKHGEIVGRKVKVPIKNSNIIEEKEVLTFFGIPFAKPPIKELRFKAPVEPEPWVEPRQAFELPKACVQVKAAIVDGFSFNISDSEDCLYLNVYVPQPVPDNAAVMVFIHGGGFTVGSSSLYTDFLALTASQNVVIVAMNYRLNSLGFLYFGNDECPGNMGIRDQLLALQWVQQNIDRFGGDPGQVTLFGQSAGSVSTGHHLLNPKAQGLFKRAILQSGSPYSTWASDSVQGALEKSQRVAKAVGCSLGNVINTMDCLRKVDAMLLTKASAGLGDLFSKYNSPVRDEEFIFSSHDSSLRAAQDKQVMLGVTTDDGGMFVSFDKSSVDGSTEPVFRYNVRKQLPGVTEDVIRSIRYYYADHCNISTEFKEEKSTVRFLSDHMFTCSSVELADDLSRAGKETYFYHFKHRMLSASAKPNWVTADHAEEMAFVLSNLRQLSGADEEALSTRMMNYWGNFAKYGNPNGMKTNIKDVNQNPKPVGRVDKWPLYTFSQKGRLDIDLHSSIQSFDILQEDQCAFWKYDYPLLSAKPSR